jgi:hypothetical protein
MTPDALEQVYEALATELDAAGDRRELLLAKLALLMAEEIGDAGRVIALLKAAAANLEA